MEDIVLERGSSGLGFTISGGADNPHLGGTMAGGAYSGIYITKLIPGGAAATDGRLKVNDVILQVNNVPVINVSHSVAVDALKRAGNRVELKVQRRLLQPHQLQHQRGYDDIIEVELIKGSKGLGFTIAGGIGNQHIPGDNGIYVTKVMDGGAAAVDGRISVGDRLVAVKNLPGESDTFLLDNCTHEEAVSALKRCKERVVLVVSKTETPYPSSPTIGQMHPMVGNFMAAAPLPARSISDEELSGPRRVTLEKSPAGLGFNIVGGEDGEGIFVSFILSGGPADLSGQVRRGDRIVAVNGRDIMGATHDEAAAALKKVGAKMELTLIYRPEEYERFEAKIHSLKNQVMSGSMIRMSEKRSLFVRALFDFDPLRSDDVPAQGLLFGFGDILHVTNASDDEWWQACRIDAVTAVDQVVANKGLIPSKARWEKKVRAKERNIRWGGGANSGSRNSLSRKKAGDNKKASMKGINNREDETFSEGDSGSLAQDGGGPQTEGNVHSYVMVQEVEIDYTRPVVILGPLKDRINDELISDFPDRFKSCIPHTTRPKREFEADGREYHFVKSRESMEMDIQNHKFIEAGQYNNNLYGTSVASVKEVAEQGKHCILDVSANAIKRLEAARLFPIAIFIKPRSTRFIRAMNEDMSEEQAEKSYNRAVRLEQDFLQFFTAIVDGDNFDQIYSKVNAIINAQAKTKIWVSAPEMF